MLNNFGNAKTGEDTATSCPSHEDNDDREAPLVYQVYLFTGAASFVCTFGLLMIYTCNKKLRMHPNGILIHLLLSLCAFSVVYLLAGITYVFNSRVLEPDGAVNLHGTGIYCHSFGIASVDSCTLESIFIVFFTFSYLGWNLVWLYDLVKVFKQPMHTTDQLLTVYQLVVYIPAFILTDLLFSLYGVVIHA